jgi:hypothetical protein
MIILNNIKDIICMILPTDLDTTMQVFWAQKCKSVFIQNQPQFGKFLNKDLNLIRIKIE